MWRNIIIAVVLIGGILGIILFAYSREGSQTANVNSSTNTNSNNVTTPTHALIKTNMGDITLELYPDKAPLTVQNFVKLAQEKFYDGTRFHRVIKDFMIQGGDPLSKDATQKNRWGTGGPGYTFQDEPNDVELVKGVIAMANSGPNTNGSQFFIITAEATPWLQGKHTAFGRVIGGLDIAEKISLVQTGVNDQPAADVIVESITIN